jgi:hypothetical protein
LQDALKNIDEEKLHTKHVFDRFDKEALITTLVRHGSYIMFIISFLYTFKCFQNNYYRQSKYKT